VSPSKQSWQVRVIRTGFRVLALLTIDLIVQIVNLRVMDLQRYLAPPIVTIIGMVSVVVLFYFLLEYIEQMTNAVLKYVVELGKTFRYRKTAVMLIIILLFFCAFFLYHGLWFNKWIGFTDLGREFSGKLIK
jgi:hypothetical protein